MSLSQRIPYSTTAGSDRQLHAAIEDGDHCRVTRLLRNGASVNCYVDGLTPVARAIIHKETSIAQELLNQRPDVHQGKRLYPRGTNTEIPVSATEKQGLHQPLLILAIINGLPDIADHLLKLGADINSTDELSHQTSLHAAVTSGQDTMVDFLLDQDPNVNRLDLQSRAPLHLAVTSGNVAITTALLDSGASVNLSGPLDMTPLHMACERGDTAMVKLLLNRASVVNARDGCQMTPLHYASSSGKLEIVRALLQRRANEWDLDDMQEMALHKALEPGHRDIVEALLEHAKVRGLFGGQGQLWTSLANQEGGQGPMKKLPLQMAVARGDHELVSLLLKHGAEVNGCDSVYGETALHWAARRGDETMLQLLIERGGDVNLASRTDGDTVLHVACLSGGRGRGVGIGRLLLAHGADVNACPDWGVRCETPLQVAVRNGYEDWVRLLLATPGIQLDACGSSGETALWLAIRNSQQDISQLLVEAGCSLNHLDTSKSSLVYAISFGAYHTASLLLQHGVSLPAGPTARDPLSVLLRNEGLPEVSASPQLLRVVELLVCAGVSVGSPRDYQSSLSQAHSTPGCHKLHAVLQCNSPVNPTSLFRSCIKKVRQKIQIKQPTRSLWPLINKLPLPAVLKEYVTFQQY